MSEFDPDAYAALCDEIDDLWDDQESTEFRDALAGLTVAAESGHVDAAEYLAEIRSLPGPHYDPAAAYKWYYVALSQRGFSVDFNDLNHKPPYYRGQDGDFRNESMVSDLVNKLGFDRVRQLDEEAAMWLRRRKGH
jgi:hypothetical protein